VNRNGLKGKGPALWPGNTDRGGPPRGCRRKVNRAEKGPKRWALSFGDDLA